MSRLSTRSRRSRACGAVPTSGLRVMKTLLWRKWKKRTRPNKKNSKWSLKSLKSNLRKTFQLRKRILWRLLPTCTKISSSKTRNSSKMKKQPRRLWIARCRLPLLQTILLLINRILSTKRCQAMVLLSFKTIPAGSINKPRASRRMKKLLRMLITSPSLKTAKPSTHLISRVLNVDRDLLIKIHQPTSLLITTLTWCQRSRNLRIPQTRLIHPR